MNKDTLKAVGLVFVIAFGAIPFLNSSAKEARRKRALDELIETKTSQIVHYNALSQADIVKKYDLNNNGILDHEEAIRLFNDYNLIERPKPASYIPN